MMDMSALHAAVRRAPTTRVTGRVVEVTGAVLEAELPSARMGGLCRIEPDVLCEVVGFHQRRALLMPLEQVSGVGYGARVSHVEGSVRVPSGPDLIGRVVDGLGRPIDHGPSLAAAPRRRLDGRPPDPMERSIISEPLPTGVRVLDGLTTVGVGQRLCVMAGSGVGKSTLMGMVARNSRADVNVICLVGERGREVREFLERDLGPEGRARSVVVVVTSDKTPVMQVKGAFTATAIAESLRDAGLNVLLMMDSLTRFAMAQRQIGLAAGEPPTTKGYTPSVFSALPQLLERAGPGAGKGSITGLYTVLVEGDDIQDPIGDAVRGTVDGHIVLSRRLASHGHYPAVDVLESLSRTMPLVTSEPHQGVASRFRDLLATWRENEELIRLGAYRKGSSAEVDEAIAKHDKLMGFLKQKVTDATPLDETLLQLAKSVS